MYIYKIVIPATGQCYIGQTTKSIQFRFMQHKNSNATSLIGRAIQHWAYPEPEIFVLHEVNSKGELNRLETKEIKERKTIFPYGYNLSAGGAAEKAKHKDDPGWQYTPDDSDINLPAIIKESKGGFTTLIKQLVQEGYIDEKKIDEIADNFEVSPKTVDPLRKYVRIANNIWRGKVEKVTPSNKKTWKTDFHIRLQQSPLSYEELLQILKNPMANSDNVRKHESYYDEWRTIFNNIHARIAETKSLRLLK